MQPDEKTHAMQNKHGNGSNNTNKTERAGSNTSAEQYDIPQVTQPEAKTGHK